MIISMLPYEKSDFNELKDFRDSLQFFPLWKITKLVTQFYKSDDQHHNRKFT